MRGGMHSSIRSLTLRHLIHETSNILVETRRLISLEGSSPSCFMVDKLSLILQSNLRVIWLLGRSCFMLVHLRRRFLIIRVLFINFNPLLLVILLLDLLVVLRVREMGHVLLWNCSLVIIVNLQETRMAV